MSWRISVYYGIFIVEHYIYWPRSTSGSNARAHIYLSLLTTAYIHLYSSFSPSETSGSVIPNQDFLPGDVVCAENSIGYLFVSKVSIVAFLFSLSPSSVPFKLSLAWFLSNTELYLFTQVLSLIAQAHFRSARHSITERHYWNYANSGFSLPRSHHSTPA